MEFLELDLIKRYLLTPSLPKPKELARTVSDLKIWGQYIGVIKA